jgi:tetratricopeptide (TPR) repeat protein
MILLPLLLQSSGPPSPDEGRYEHCVALVGSDPIAATRDATAWQLAGGKYLARQCLALAYAQTGNYPAAGAEFDEAARLAQDAHDVRAARLWAQAGNVWLAANNGPKARVSLDAALAAGTLTGLDRGEATLDRARALVLAADLTDARRDIDAALKDADADPLAWLLSASLARRMGDLPRAKADIAQALARSADDASVQLEAGNIAAESRDEAGARQHWQEASRIGGDRPVGRSARTALAQFGS